VEGNHNSYETACLAEHTRKIKKKQTRKCGNEETQ